MPDPIRFDVYVREDCPASKATIALLDDLDADYTVRDWNRQRAWLQHQRFHVSPAVCVYMGSGERRRRWTSWCGHQPKMIELALGMGGGE